MSGPSRRRSGRSPYPGLKRQSPRRLRVHSPRRDRRPRPKIRLQPGPRRLPVRCRWPRRSRPLHRSDLMTWFVGSGAAPLWYLRFVGQSHLDALLRILSEFEGFDTLGEIEEVRLNRREIELGAGQEPQSRGPNARRTDRALDGQRLSLNLAELDRNLAADADADKGNAPTDAHIIEHRRQRGVVARGLDDQIGALAAGQLKHLANRIARAGIDRGVDAEFLRRRT